MNLSSFFYKYYIDLLSEVLKIAPFKFERPNSPPCDIVAQGSGTSTYSSHLPSTSSSIITEHSLPDESAAGLTDSLTDSGHISAAEEAEEEIFRNIKPQNLPNNNLICKRNHSTEIIPNFNNDQQLYRKFDRSKRKRNAKNRSAKSAASPRRASLVIETTGLVTGYVDINGTSERRLSNHDEAAKSITLRKKFWSNLNSSITSVNDASAQSSENNSPATRQNIHKHNNNNININGSKPSSNNGPSCSLEADGEVVIEDDDLPSDLYNHCKSLKRIAANSSHVASASPRYFLLGDESDLALEAERMRALARCNPYIPSVLLENIAEERRHQPFVKNKTSGNAVSLPNFISYGQAPNSERLKVIVVGKSGVGKTTIVFRHRYANCASDSLRPFGATIGATYFNLDLKVNGIPLHLQVWDTAGQERFRCMVPMYVRNASAAVLIYDITDRSSFDEIDSYIAEINRTRSDTHDPLIVVVGNKCDLEARREVACGEGMAKAVRLNARFFEVTATNTIMITALLAHIAEGIYESDKELMNRLAKNYDTRNGTSRGGLRVLKANDRFASKCCNIG